MARRWKERRGCGWGEGEGEGEESVKARGARDRDAGAVRVVLAFSTGVLVRFVGWRGGDSFEGPRRPPAGGARGTVGPQPAGPHAQRVAVVACRLPGPLRACLVG
jgi:hypothetical protein